MGGSHAEVQKISHAAEADTIGEIPERTAEDQVVAQSPALFNTIEYRTDDHDGLPKWKQVMQKVATEKMSYAACANRSPGCRSKAISAWQGMIKAQKGVRQIDQLKAVTSFVNQWRYPTDQYNYGKSDY